MIKNFEDYTKIQSFGNGFTQWKKGDLEQSSRVCIEDSGVTRDLVRSAFKTDINNFGQVFKKSDAMMLGLPK